LILQIFITLNVRKNTYNATQLFQLLHGTKKHSHGYIKQSQICFLIILKSPNEQRSNRNLPQNRWTV